MATRREAPPEVWEQIRDLDDNVLACRTIRHAWAVDQPFYKVDVEGGEKRAMYVERRLGCMRCSTVRVLLYRVHDHWLEQLSSRYIYPEGYHLKGKPDQPVSQLVSFEQYRRTVQDLPRKV